MKNLFLEALTKAKQERRKSSALFLRPMFCRIIVSATFLLFFGIGEMWGIVYLYEARGDGYYSDRDDGPNYNGYFPSPNYVVTEDCPAYKFLGWTADAIYNENGTTTPPTSKFAVNSQVTQNYVYAWYTLYATFEGGTTNTYKHITTAASWTSDTGGTQTLNDKSWTATASGDVGTRSYDEEKGFRFGSGSKPPTGLTLSSNAFSGNIESVIIETSCGGSLDAEKNIKLSVTVGGTPFHCNGMQNPKIRTTNQSYTFDGMGSGNIVVTWSSSEDLAIFVKSFSVKYNTGATITYYTNPNCSCEQNAITLSGSPEGTLDHGNISASSSSACEGTEITLTATPATGYELYRWSVLKTSDGTDVSEDVYLMDGEFLMPDYGVTVNATFTAKIYAVGLDDEGATTAVDPDGVYTTYNSNELSDNITNPEKDCYTFAGWWSEDNGTGYEVINTSGALNANVEGFTGASGIWIKDADVTLYAKWVPHTHKLTVGSPENVAITATPAGGSVITEGNSNAAVDYGKSITLAYSSITSGYTWSGWQVTKDEDGTDVTTSVVDGNTLTMPDYDVTVTANVFTYTDYVFSCAELTLTAHPETASGPIFITSTASKKVRSQGYIQITGSGLTPSTTLTFPSLPATFEIKTATYGDLATDVYGAIDAAAYIFYTPAADATSDGLDKITGITVTVEGAKPKTANLTQDIIGRHLPTNFVIAGKKDNKWYALPSNMESTSHPAPVEIAVDNLNNPSIAYTVASNKYGMVGPTNSNISGGNGQFIRFTMSINDGNDPAGPAPLFGTNVNDIGKSGPAKATSDLSAGWWWKLQQENTSITNPQDAKYKIYCANNTSTLSIKDNAGNAEWGLYASGVEELRLIPASDIIYTEAYFVEWGQHGGVVEVDATGIGAISVVAHLGEATSSAITLSQTGTSVKGSATKYNYTVNFGEGIDFAAAESNGALLRLEWKNGEAVKAMTSLVVPKIIASDATMSSLMSGDEVWRTEVHVLPGYTLTADAGSFLSGDVTIKQLEIYPGAIVKVTTGTLDISTLVLRNGWTRVGTKDYNVAQLQIKRGDGGANVTKSNNTDNWYTDWYIDYDQYYPIAVPWNVTVANIKYKNSNSAASAGMKLRYYDGEQRASSGQSQVGQNWKEYSPLPTTLSPSKAYAMTAKRPSGKAFSIIRMPLTFPGAAWTALGEQGEVESTYKNQVTVTGWGLGTSTPWYAMGWNFIGNPYMSIFNGDDNGISGKLELQNGGTIRYATIPDLEFQNYYQVPIAEARINPASGFFIQANKAGEQTVTFAANQIDAPSAAPARFLTQDVTLPEQEAYILLSYEGGKDQMGLIIGDDYTADYEVNADLAKVLGEGNFVKTYMNYGGMDMAYVAINSTLAKEWIPVTVTIPAAGEYTFSLTNSSSVDELEGVFLIDYANGSVITNLIGNDYVFTAEEGTITDRFAINATYGGRETPTLIDAVQSGAIDSDKPIKFLFHEKVYILYQGIIYDAVGKKVSEINK